LRVIFMGTPEFAVPSLEYLILNQYEVVAVYTQPDRPAGRGRSLASPPVKRAALAWELPVVQPVNLRGPEVVAMFPATGVSISIPLCYLDFEALHQ